MAGNRYEGLWNGKTVARIAQKTLEIEEAGLVDVATCGDIPRKNRVRLVALSYDPGYRFDESSSPEPHYSLEWSRNIVDSMPLESVKEYLPVSAEERTCAWGPGRFPWHMVFQYDPEWAQWKMSSPQWSSSVTVDPKDDQGVPEATKSSIPIKTASWPASRPSLSSQRSNATGKADRPSDAAGEKQINLFWDHWRLKQMPLRGSGTTAVKVEKEAARGGRSYGDAQANGSSDTYPSHLLISLP